MFGCWKSQIQQPNTPHKTTLLHLCFQQIQLYILYIITKSEIIDSGYSNRLLSNSFNSCDIPAI